MPRPDAVDDELFIETSGTASATVAPWTMSGLSSQDPYPWSPIVILHGEPHLARLRGLDRPHGIAPDAIVKPPALPSPNDPAS